VRINKEPQVEYALDVSDVPKSELYNSKSDFHRAKADGKIIKV
jgi:hypothetical protein